MAFFFPLQLFISLLYPSFETLFIINIVLFSSVKYNFQNCLQPVPVILKIDHRLNHIPQYLKDLELSIFFHQIFIQLLIRNQHGFRSFFPFF